MAIIGGCLGWRKDDQEVIPHWECSENSAQSDSRYGEAAIMRHIPGGSHPVLWESGKYACLWKVACRERRKFTWIREKLICWEKNTPILFRWTWQPIILVCLPGNCPNSSPQAENPRQTLVETLAPGRSTFGSTPQGWLPIWTVHWPVYKERVRIFLWR